MAIPTPSQTIIDPNGDPSILRREISLATANGGLYVFETTSNIYVTAVSQNYTTQRVTNITNDPGNIANGVQFNSGGNFVADSDFTYNANTDTLNVENITVSGGIANLGPVANIRIANGSSGQVLRTDGAGNLSWVTVSGGGGGNAVIIANEYHVATNGSDSSGDGSQSNPFATIGNAIARVGANAGYKVIVHAGSYSENVTISTTNTSLVAAQSDIGASPLINGTLIVSGSATAVKVQGITANTINVTTSGTTYFTQTKAANGVNKTGSGYLEVIDSDWAVSGGNALFNAGTTTTNGTKLANVQVQGTAIINMKNSIQLSNVIANGSSAVVSIDDSYVYAPTNGANAVNVINGALTARSSLFLNPDLTTARIGITAGFLGYDDISFDKANSTLGAGLNATAYFQDIDAENFTASGNIVGNLVNGNSNIVISANSNVSFGVAGNAAAFTVGANSVTVRSTNGNLVLGRATATGSPGLSSTTSMTFTANRGGTEGNMILNTSGNLSVSGALSLGGNAIIAPDSNNLEVRGVNNFNVEANGVVNIYTDASGNAYQWQFGDDGILSAPGNIVPTSTFLLGSGNANLYLGDPTSASADAELSAAGNTRLHAGSAEFGFKVDGNLETSLALRVITSGATISFNTAGNANSNVSISNTGMSITSGLSVSGAANVTGTIRSSDTFSVNSANNNTAINNLGSNGTGNIGANATSRFNTAFLTGVDASGNITAGNLITTGSLSSAANLTLTSGSNSWVFGTDGKLTLPSGGNIAGDGSSPGPRLSSFDFVGTANANVGQTLNVVGNTNLSVLNVAANANLQGGTTISGNIIANVTLNTGVNPWSIGQSGGNASLIIDSDSVDISGNVTLPANITVSGGSPTANTTATITHRLPVTINGNTYYIMLSS